MMLEHAAVVGGFVRSTGDFELAAVSLFRCWYFDVFRAWKFHASRLQPCRVTRIVRKFRMGLRKFPSRNVMVDDLQSCVNILFDYF